MTNSMRRKTDQGSSAARSESAARGGGDAAATEWVQNCATRLVALEPQLSLEDATQIAASIREFERTGAMDPGAAADFVSGEMQKAQRTRFERRSGAVAPGR